MNGMTESDAGSAELLAEPKPCLGHSGQSWPVCRGIPNTILEWIPTTRQVEVNALPYPAVL